MLDVRPIFFVIGILLVTLAAGMGVPTMTNLVAGQSDSGGSSPAPLPPACSSASA